MSHMRWIFIRWPAFQGTSRADEFSAKMAILPLDSFLCWKLKVATLAVAIWMIVSMTNNGWYWHIIRISLYLVSIHQHDYLDLTCRLRCNLGSVFTTVQVTGVTSECLLQDGCYGWSKVPLALEAYDGNLAWNPCWSVFHKPSFGC